MEESYENVRHLVLRIHYDRYSCLICEDRSRDLFSVYNWAMRSYVDWSMNGMSLLKEKMASSTSIYSKAKEMLPVNI
jgi:hypothetical protein